MRKIGDFQVLTNKSLYFRNSAR